MSRQNQISVKSILRSKEWREAFKHVPGGFDVKLLSRVVAVSEKMSDDEYDDGSLLGLFRLKDGRYVVLDTSYDGTHGFSSTMGWYASLEEAERMGLSPSQHEELFPAMTLRLTQEQLEVTLDVLNKYFDKKAIDCPLPKPLEVLGKVIDKMKNLKWDFDRMRLSERVKAEEKTS